MRTGGVEPPQREASRLQRGELAGCSASARGRGERLQPLSWVTDPGGHAQAEPGDRLKPGTGKHDREAGTTGLEPAPSRLTSERSARLSYAPVLQLRGWDSNPRSRAH